MARGADAKKLVIDKIKEAFGADYIGESANKHYVWSKEGGEKIQVAISLTCPKNPIGEVSVSTSDGFDFSAEPVLAQTKFEPAEITDQEKDNLKELMERLGL